MILVIAPDVTAYNEYINKNNLSTREAKRILSPWLFKGYRPDIRIVAVGDWYKNPDCIETRHRAIAAGYSVSEERV